MDVHGLLLARLGATAKILAPIPVASASLPRRIAALLLFDLLKCRPWASESGAVVVGAL
jgi:hypothetical protein